MNEPTESSINFIQAIFGLVAAPKSTIEQLLESEFPPFIFSSFLCLLITVTEPLAVRIVKLNLPMETKLMPLAILTFTLLFILLSILFLSIAVNLLSIQLSLEQAAAVVAYALIPFMVSMWIVYLFNYWHDGSTTLILFIITGYTKISHEVFTLIPYAISFAALEGIYILFLSLKIIGAMHWLSAMISTIFSLGTLVFAATVSSLASSHAFPGMLTPISRLIREIISSY